MSSSVRKSYRPLASRNMSTWGAAALMGTLVGATAWQPAAAQIRNEPTLTLLLVSMPIRSRDGVCATGELIRVPSPSNPLCEWRVEFGQINRLDAIPIRLEWCVPCR